MRHRIRYSIPLERTRRGSQMRKIALTGAHGTGKTTLAKALANDLESLGRLGACREAPRLIIERVGDPEFFRRGNNTPARQAMIFLEHVLEEQRQAVNCDILITDRTLVDHLAYTAILFPDAEKSLEFEVYKKISFETLGDYGTIFKLPIEFTLVDDGVREAELEFQVAIDRKIDDLYREAKVAPVVVSGSVKERAALVFHRVRKLLG
jgi:predicted ATPase